MLRPYGNIFVNMKRISILLVALLTLVGCQDQVQQIAGTYSYKISGRGTIAGINQTLDDEIGTMEIVYTNSRSALVTFNALRGHAYSTTAAVDGKQLSLDPFERDVKEGGLNYLVTASGEGTVYGNTLLILLKYEGNTLQADSLTLLCKRN